MTVWWTMGFNAVIYLAGLQDIPRRALRGGRARRGLAWQQFRYITLPGLRPVLIFIIIMTILASANMFGQSYLITQGGPGDTTRTAIMVITDLGLSQYRMGQASAMSYVLAVFLGSSRWSTSGAQGEEMSVMEWGDRHGSGDRRPGGRRRGEATQADPLFWVTLVMLAVIFIGPLSASS